MSDRRPGRRVALRADAGPDIGHGHIMRCVALASELRRIGFECHFLARLLPEILASRIEADGHIVHILGDLTGALGDKTASEWAEEEDARAARDVLAELQPVEWLIVDSYGLGVQWESCVRDSCSHLMVVDDLANRAHDCDLILDQNLHAARWGRYDSLVPEQCVRFLGASSALLRREFVESHGAGRVRSPSLERVLISYGGADPTGETVKALAAIRRLDFPLEATVAVSSACPSIDDIRRLSGEVGAELAIDAPDMARLMDCSDLALGGAGATSVERCFMGLPSIVTVVAANQLDVAAELKRSGASMVLGESGVVSPDSICQALACLRSNPEWIQSASLAASALVPSRAPSTPLLLVREMARPFFPECPQNRRLRLASDDDMGILYEWRNKPRVREGMFDDSLLTPEGHLCWWESWDSSVSCRLIYEVDGLPVGFVHLSNISLESGECVFGFYRGHDAFVGEGTRMCILALDFAFRRGIRRICSEILEDNVASLRLHEALGFDVAGRRRRPAGSRGETGVVALEMSVDTWYGRRTSLWERLD